MTCQHPNCSRHVHSICANHCLWSLCEDHINEHRRTLDMEFEEVLQNLIKPTDELFKSIEQTKQSLNTTQQQELELLKQSYEKRIDQIDEQLQEINHLQEQCREMSERLIRMKANEQLLTQDDFQQIEFLTKQLKECQKSFTDKDDKPINIQVEKSAQTRLHQCPLTALNIYGLTSSHNVPLCSSKKKIRNLHEHFRVYHHLDTHFANELLKAVKLNLDPVETMIFPSDTKISTLGDRRPCPFHDTPEGGEIRCTPCPHYITEKYLPVHLKIAHRLRLPQINELLNRN